VGVDRRYSSDGTGDSRTGEGEGRAEGGSHSGKDVASDTSSLEALECVFCGKKAVVAAPLDRRLAPDQPRPWWETPVGVFVWFAGFCALASLAYYLWTVGGGDLPWLSVLIAAWVYAGVETILWARRPRRKDSFRKFSVALRLGDRVVLRRRQRAQDASQTYLWCRACGRLQAPVKPPSYG
jgi:hypothetical protein